MTNNKSNSKFNLEERTAKFGEDIIKFCTKITRNIVNEVLLKQLLRSGTSVGANYMEANGADSKKDFKSKIGICKKESKETMHWLIMFAIATPENKEAIAILWKEAKELSLIFGAINRKKPSF